MALFLSIMELIRQAPEDKMFVTGGRFLDEQGVKSNKQLHNMKMLRAIHEEADTLLILYDIHSDPDTIVVRARDTDVLLPKINCAC